MANQDILATIDSEPLSEQPNEMQLGEQLGHGGAQVLSDDNSTGHLQSS